jgi:arginine exporter protein ArgO
MGWMWVMIGILVLFNPLVPILLRRHTWQIIDLVAAGVFVVVAFALRATPGAKRATAQR